MFLVTFCRSQWCHRLEFWLLIGQLRLFHVTPRSERLPLEWMMKQTKSEFVVKLQVEITSFLKMLSTMISYNCVSRKFHYIRSKTIEIRQNFQHSIDTSWKVSLQYRGVWMPNSTTATDRIDKFWKEHDRQIKKNACKNAYLGSIFIPEKYVIRVLFVSPWTSLIPPLAIRVPPPPGFHDSCARPS